MVYCTKCGTLNSDDASVCTKCGASLKPAAWQDWEDHWKHRHYEHEYHHYYHGPGIGALVVGVIIVLFGLSFLFSEVYGFSLPFWPIVFILIGLWILYAGLRRSRRYRATPPPP